MTSRQIDSSSANASVMRRLLTGLIAAGAVALVAACTVGSSGAPTHAPSAPGLATVEPGPMSAEVSVAEAAALRDAGAVVLDVREPDEWAAGHIAGAMLIPLGSLESRLGELPSDRDIVVVCRSGNRSARGRDILRANGLERSTSMAGGMNDWVSAGLPVETGS